MEWKQPEGLKRRWVLSTEEMELAFGGWRFAGARGRIGSAHYELVASGFVRKRLTLLEDGKAVATMEPNFSGTSAAVKYGDTLYTWKVTNIMATRWSLLDASKKVVFTVRRKGALRIQGAIEIADNPAPGLEKLLLLCWFAQVLLEQESTAPAIL